jgi:hypothetical protein
MENGEDRKISRQKNGGRLLHGLRGLAPMEIRDGNAIHDAFQEFV